MRGKEKCKALKEIRRQIAEKNDIPFAVSQCTHQGDCKGTCPKCEAELAYLEKELALRSKLGKSIAVAGISIGICAGLTGCGPASGNTGTPVNQPTGTNIQDIAGDISIEPDPTLNIPKNPDDLIDPEKPIELEGDVIAPEDPMEIDGGLEIFEEPEEPVLLEGDVAIPED